MASVNKVILVGHLGKDPDVRYTPAGDAAAPPKAPGATGGNFNDLDHDIPL